MELWEQLLCRAVMSGRVEIKLEKDFDLNTLLENKCYNALMQIKRIIDDDRLDDKECFERIEEIVCIFEELGSDCGGRHDF